jgi:hypothetical protein
MDDGVIYLEVSQDEFRDIFKETINSLDTHEPWEHTGTFVIRAFPCTTASGQRALRVTLSDGDEWLVAERN